MIRRETTVLKQNEIAGESYILILQEIRKGPPERYAHAFATAADAAVAMSGAVVGDSKAFSVAAATTVAALATEEATVFLASSSGL